MAMMAWYCSKQKRNPSTNNESPVGRYDSLWEDAAQRLIAEYEVNEIEQGLSPL